MTSKLIHRNSSCGHSRTGNGLLIDQHIGIAIELDLNRFFPGLSELNEFTGGEVDLNRAAKVAEQTSTSETTLNEALLGKTIAIRSGLKEEQIIINKTGLNTEAEASFIAALSASKKWDKLIISTSAFHMPRALKKVSSLSDSLLTAAPSDFRKVRTAKLFNNSQLNLFVPTLSALNESTRSIKEYLGILRESLKQ